MYWSTLYDHDSTWYLSTLTYFLICSLLSCLVIFALLGMYNRYFHPLRYIPGPFWSSVTDLYKLFVLCSDDVSRFSLELHERYGETVLIFYDTLC